MCLSLEDDIDSGEHDHVKGHINYCELCWWKEIKDDNENLIYFSTKACTCSHNLHFRKHVSICKTMKTNQSSDILQHSQNRPTGDRWLKF